MHYEPSASVGKSCSRIDITPLETSFRDKSQYEITFNLLGASGAGRRLKAPEPGTEDDSTCDEPSQFTERERPRPQGSSPVEEYPETEKYTDSDKECEAEHDPYHKSGSGKKSKKSGLGSMFEKRSTPKMSKLKEDHSPESGVMVKTAQDGCSEGLVYGGGGREGIFIKEVVPESPASNLKLKEGDRILSATVYFDNMSYEDAIQILEHAQAYKVKLCLKRTPVITETEPVTKSDVIPEEDVYAPEMRENGKTKRRSDARISWPKFPSFGKGKKKSRFSRSHSSSEAEEQRKLELSPTTSDTESPIKSQDALKAKKKHKIKLPLLSKRGRISSSEDQDTDAPTTAQLVSPETLESPSGETPQVYVTEELMVVEDLRWEEKEPKTVQHKVELITIDSTLKTEDLTLALAGTKAEIKFPKAPKMDVSIEKAEVFISEAKVEVKKPEKEIKLSQTGIELEGNRGKFKIPKFGITMPTFEGPDIDSTISKTNIDVKIPEAKAKVELPEAPKIAVEMKPPEYESERDGKGSKFKMPKFGISMPKVKGPQIDLSIPKKDKDVTLPEAKTEVKLPDAPTIDVDIKAPECEAEMDVQGSKFKMPKFGITFPKVKGPEIDLSISKKDVDVTLPEAKAEVDLPEAPIIDVDMKAPECEAEMDVPESKFKMPKFGMKMPKVKGPQIDLSFLKKDVDVTIPEAKAEVELSGAPTIAVDMKLPEGEAEMDGQGSKFNKPKFGISMPKVKGSETDFSYFSITIPENKLPDVELKQPSAKVEIKAPEIEAQGSSKKGSPSKFKMPTFNFPKFGAATPNLSAEVPDIEKEIKIDGADLRIAVPHTDVDAPDVKAEVRLPEIEVKHILGTVVIEQQPEVEIDAKLKKRRFSMPRFSFSKGSVKAPEVDANVQDVNVAIPDGKVEVKVGEVETKLPECEADVDRKGSKFKMSTFGITMPKVTGTEIDLSLSKKDVDIKLPEAKAEVQLPEIKIKQPSASVEIKAHEIDRNKIGDVEGSLSKLKMPTFTVPTFGAATSKVSVDKPDLDLHIDGATVDVTAPSIDTENLSVDIKAKESDIERSGSKFKMPKFGISMPRVKGPELDSSLSKKDLEVTLPKAKAEINLASVEITQPEVEIKAPEIKVATKDKEGSPSKFKMPTIKLPTFGVNIPSATVEVSEKDKDIRIDGADITIPEEVLAVHITAPIVDTEDPSIVIKTEGKESKFKLPSLGFSGPQIKQPDLDLGLEKKDMHVTLPAKAEVNLPDVGLKEPSAQVDIKGPQIKMGEKEGNVEGKHPAVEVKPQEGAKAKVKLPEARLKDPSTEVEMKGPEIKIATQEPAKTVEKEEQKDEKSPVGETSDEEISPTSSVQSSDAFADISSAMTSEHLGLSLSSPTKVVTVRFSDPNVASGLVAGGLLNITVTESEIENRMTEVMNSLEPGTEDFSGGGAAADQGAIFPDTHERYPKLSKRLPSIVVEPTDGAEVESGELRWPPDEPSSPD
ncbi:hypothetical protein JOQ06_029063, partial [Pogonophryne albipinna]